MRCFLACFGCSKKQKRRKPANKDQPRDQRLGSYEPLNHTVSLNLDITQNPTSSDSEFSDKRKERSSFRIRKKVSFNLNVEAYEPILNVENTNYFLASEEDQKWEKNEEETAKASVSPSLSEGDSIASYPSNYRYRNCIDSYDEEDDIKLEESDLGDDDDYDEDDDDDDSEGNVDDQTISQEEFTKQFYPSSLESRKSRLAEDKINNLTPLHASPDREVKTHGSNRNAQDRSQYIHSVLKPVENLTQWKAVKARATPPIKQKRKETMALEQEPHIPLSSNISFNPSPFDFTPNFNQSKPLMQEMAVDASLSNWLASSKTTLVTKSGTVEVATTSSEKNTLHKSNSSRSEEYKPILQITKSVA